jgi:membrane dipeptidase
MNPHRLLACFLLFSGLALAQHPQHKTPAKAASQTRPKTDTAQTIHQSALVVDTHADTPQRFLDENFDLGRSSKATMPNAPWT